MHGWWDGCKHPETAALMTMQVERVSEDGSFFGAAIHAAALARRNLGARVPSFASVDVAGAAAVNTQIYQRSGLIPDNGMFALDLRQHGRLVETTLLRHVQCMLLCTPWEAFRDLPMMIFRVASGDDIWVQVMQGVIYRIFSSRQS